MHSFGQYIHIHGSLPHGFPVDPYRFSVNSAEDMDKKIGITKSGFFVFFRNIFTENLLVILWAIANRQLHKGYAGRLFR
jgi:hypothetical protein